MGIIFAESNVVNRLKKFEQFGHHLFVELFTHDNIDHRISHHTDLMVFVHDKIYCEHTVYHKIYKQLELAYGEHWAKQHTVCGESEIRTNYPEDVKYNILLCTNHMFHRLNATDKRISEAVQLQKVNVKQGYTRCACLPVGKDAIITEDVKLGHTIAEHGYDVLIVERGHVELEGFSYGFFGGAGGQIDDMIVFNGSLKMHPNYIEIKHFIENRGLRIVELHEEGLVDCGSILYYL